MIEKKEGPNIKFFKILLAVIAIVSLIFVLYNISAYTNDSDVEVFAGSSF